MPDRGICVTRLVRTVRLGMMHRHLRATAAVICAATVALAATPASADTRVIPDTPNLPWSDPRHETPLERVASGIATTIAGRPVLVRCNGLTDWVGLVSEFGVDARSVWGFTDMPGPWSPESGTWLESSTHVHLGPLACGHLWRYAKAAIKPTKCSAWRVWKGRTTNGRLTRSVAVDPRPCAGPRERGVTVARPAGGWTTYGRYASAMQALAHESVHLHEFTAGRPLPASTQEMESHAECVGMQHISRVASALGASTDDAASIATWYARRMYPARKTHTPEYWSADCRAGGPLDISPGDGRWP